MSKVQTLRVFVTQRLTAAAEEIFELFERTIAEYEEQLGRQTKLLNAAFKPEVRLDRADVQLLLASEEDDPPEHRDWIPSLDQGDPPELPHIKEEQEEVWTSEDREQLGGPGEAELIEFTSTAVTVKSEDDDDEEPHTSHLHHSEEMESEAVGEGPEPAKNLDPLQPHADSKTSDCSEPDDVDLKKSSGSLSTLNILRNDEEPLSDEECFTGETSSGSSGGSDLKRLLKEHKGTGVKPFSCSVCGRRYPLMSSLTAHRKIHSEGKHVSCPVCKKKFIWRSEVVRHMRIHTGEKPFRCPVCGVDFSQQPHLTQHMRVHTKERPYSCSLCGKTYTVSTSLLRHQRDHTGERPFACSVCKASFKYRSDLSRHTRLHSGEKPFSCSVCGKNFRLKSTMTQHVKVHTGERPFGCSVCGKKFRQRSTMVQHSRVHTGEKPFSCSVCQTSFADRSTFSRHVRTHKEKPSVGSG